MLAGNLVIPAVALGFGAALGFAVSRRLAAARYSLADQEARFARHKATRNRRVLEPDSFYDGSRMRGKRVVVTGANRGVGLALCKQLAVDGARVVAACRRSSPELEAVKVERIVTGVDVTEDVGAERLVRALLALKGNVDVVINNAGYFYGPFESLDALNFAEEMNQINICAIGPLRITAAIAKAPGLLEQGAKVAMITSQGGSVSWRNVQNPKGGDYGHHMSKAAANMASVLLAKELSPRGIAVLLLHPGFNRTEMTAKYKEAWDREGAVEVDVCAKRVLHEVALGSMDTSGRFINCEDGLEIPF